MLLDTSGLLSIKNDRDPHYKLAIERYDSATFRLTHNYVMAEYAALAQSRGRPRLETLEFLDTLVSTPEVEKVWVDRDLHVRALALLQARLDKTYSLCDAVSFLLMRQYSIDEALTTDHHFEQEGFIRLLK